MDLLDINHLSSLLVRKDYGEFNFSYDEPDDWDEESKARVFSMIRGREYIMADGIDVDDARLITEALRQLPKLIEIAAEKFERATCEFEGCAALAQWCYMPAGGVGEYCDDHVPRGCSCNVIDIEGPSYEQYRDDQGRLLPCVEYNYYPLGFEPIDREEVAAYRAKNLIKLPPVSDA